MGKTIWVFHHYADPPDGHWTNHYDLFEQVVRNGHRVTIFSSSFSHYTRQDNRLGPDEKFRAQHYNGVRFIFIKTSPYSENNWRRYCNFLSYAVMAFYVAMRDKEKPDLVIGSSPHPFCAFVAYWVARRKSVPFFFEVHDLWPQFFIELGTFSEGHPVVKGLRWMEKFLYCKSDKVLPLWPRMNLYIQQFGVPRDKIVWMPMGLNLEKMENSVPLSETKRNDFVVMYRGRFGLTQEMTVLLQAAKMIQAKGFGYIKFEFIGEGPELEHLIGKVRDIGLTNVRFREFTPKSEMLQDMKKSDVLIGSLPNLPHFKKYGMISTKLIDYMVAGRPVIFAANDKNHLVAKVKAGIVVPPDSPKAMADAILRIAAMSAEEQARMGENGVRYVRKNHDVKILAKRLESLI